MTHSGGPLLILAGPGSGKTAVITRRIAYQVHARALPVQRIVALTFTNRAAAEMKDRLERLLPGDEQPYIGTFHWLCGALLRRHGHRAGHRPGFRLLTPRESRSVLQLVLEGFPAALRARRGAVAAAISMAKNGLSQADAAAAHGLDANVIASISAVYDSRVRALGALDLDDLQSVTLDVLRNDEGVRRRCSATFSEFLIDEYQDTNPVQGEIVRLLAPLGDNVTAVGDEDQAIYGWRGAGEGGISRFMEAFPHARVLVLEETYRCTKCILRAASSLIRHNKERRDKVLRTVHPAGEVPVCYAALDEKDEAGWIASEICRLTSGGEYEPSDIAVLNRVNAQARTLEDALLRASIPYRVFGGHRFYEQPEIRSAAAYLRLALDERDDEAAAYLAGAVDGMGEKRLLRLREDAEAKGSGLLDVMAGGHPELPKAVAARLEELEERIRAVRGRRADSLRSVVDAAIAATAPGIIDEGTDIGDSGIEVLHELRTMSRELTDRRTTLRAFVDMLSLTEAAAGGPRVTLMSVHSAKGLEFPIVFMAGMEDGLFPHRRSLDRGETIEEERRLCYVGMTRARTLLNFSYTHMRFLGGQALAGPPSRFLTEMGQANVRFVTSPKVVARPRLVAVAPGEVVEHSRWGRGVVVAVAGRGRETMATIDFTGAGRQRVQLCHAPLKRITEEHENVRAG